MHISIKWNKNKPIFSCTLNDTTESCHDTDRYNTILYGVQQWPMEKKFYVHNTHHIAGLIQKTRNSIELHIFCIAPSTYLGLTGAVFKVFLCHVWLNWVGFSLQQCAPMPNALPLNKGISLSPWGRYGISIVSTLEEIHHAITKLDISYFVCESGAIFPRQSMASRMGIAALTGCSARKVDMRLDSAGSGPSSGGEVGMACQAPGEDL